MNGQNQTLEERDGESNECPAPFICQGLSALALDVKGLHVKVDSLQRNQRESLGLTRRIGERLGIVELDVPGKGRFRGPAWVAAVLALALAVSVIAWQWRHIAATFGR